MDVPFTAEQEARLQQMAERSGRSPEQVVLEAVDLLIEDAKFAEAVERGMASLRGEYVPHEEVGTRINKLLGR